MASRRSGQGFASRRPHEGGEPGIVEELGQRLVALGQIPGEDEHPGRGVVQPHSMMRSRNIRSVDSRRRTVAVASRGPLVPAAVASRS